MGIDYGGGYYPPDNTDGIIINTQWSDKIESVKDVYDRYNRILSNVIDTEIWDMLPISEELTYALEKCIETNKNGENESLLCGIIDTLCEKCIRVRNNMDNIENGIQELSLCLEKLKCIDTPSVVMRKLSEIPNRTQFKDKKYCGISSELKTLISDIKSKCGCKYEWSDIKCLAIKVGELLVSEHTKLKNIKKQHKWYSSVWYKDIRACNNRIIALEQFHNEIITALMEYSDAKKNAVKSVLNRIKGE